MSVTAATSVEVLCRERSIDSGFRLGVSLHSHTLHSEESLSIIPAWIAKRLGISESRNAFWRPPLSPRQAYRLEQKQIEEEFQLPGIVSLTDHDDIRAGRLLRVLDRFRDAPVSTEWTVPFGATFFHLGVHNLKPSRASIISRELAEFTAKPGQARLREILENLNADRRVLVVFNHPLWDERGIGRAKHFEALSDLLAECGECIHALEVNGLRSWHENRQVLRMGVERNFPVVAGGDRHGLEPNSILNLSRAGTLAEFVEEVRREKRSHIVLMPQYRRCRKIRVFQMVVDALREYPEFEGRRNWRERVFYRDPETGTTVPFTRMEEADKSKTIEHLLAAARLVDRRSPSAILTSA